MGARFNLLKFTCVVTLVDILITGACGTVCSDAVTDGTTVLKMCEDGNVEGERVVIDTYELSGYRNDGGSIKCSCTATLGGLSDGTSTTVDFGPVQTLYRPSECGSVVTLTPQLHGLPMQPNIYLCSVANTTFNRVRNNDTFTVVWDSGVSGSTSGYCLMLEAGTGSSLSLKCNPALSTSSTMMVTTELLNTTTTTLTPSTPGSSATTPTTVTRTTSTTRDDVTTPDDVTTTDDVTTPDDVTSGRCRCDEPDFPFAAVIVPIVVSVLVVALGTAVNIFLYRRRLTLTNEPKSGTHGMTSTDPVHYDSLDQSRVELPNTYEEISTRQAYVNMASH
ncbi:uncharacterized protein LOC117327717 isoform X2 [Pecten maximus]|uniref:uncharacterized protein LOC117327717 isoform X2 n=1 Tax=Pecten maximus TaxID=6579 RepID=UPI0014581811|nr:uncharacterized protein LOC117327717 isoform X2 [Pecten maximus]